MFTALTQAENDFLRDIGLFGAAVYPVKKLGKRHWI